MSTKKLARTTYNANQRCGDGPAELPPHKGIIPYHVPEGVVESVDAERPAYRDALEEDQEEKAEARHGVRVEDLEDVHAALGDTGYPDDVGEHADDRDEDLLASAKQLRPLVHLGQRSVLFARREGASSG